jgi:multiple sugar transport system permease protein
MEATETTIVARKRRLNNKQRDTLAFYAFISPWILGFVFLLAGPILASLYLSFTDYNIIQAPRFIGLRNFTGMFSDPLFGKALWNTAYFVFFFVGLGVVIAFLLAMLLNQKVRGLAVYRTIFYLPSVVPIVASAILWLWLFNPQWGLINQGLSLIGIEGPGWLSSEAWAKPAIILMSVWSLGNWIIIYLAALQGIPAQLYEAADIDGASPLQKFFRITVPLMTPTIFFTMIIGTITAFQVFTQAYVMTNGGPLNSTLFYALYLYRQAFNYLHMGFASAMAWFLFVIILILTVLQFRVSDRWVHYGT